MYRFILFSIASCMILLIYPSQAITAQHQAHGSLNFDVSCSEAVQEDFDQALAMLHSMMYETAREAFEEIKVNDPTCAMAYWGVATTLFQPLWGTRPSAEDLNRGWSNSEKAMELVNSEREKHLIKSTAEFFRDPDNTDFWTRIERWSDAMENAYQEYSDDPDVASFYSLSRLTLAQRADDRTALQDEAETILRKVYEKENLHPGAIHYSIHATDVDGRAENALDMVEAYSQIAPDVPHALHMPTHIYVRLGDWPKVIEWNKKSADAALNHPVNGTISHHYIHAIDYLIYAYLQQGEDEKIEPLLEEVESKEKHQPSTVSAFHFAAIPARMAVERREWEKAAAIEPRTPEYLPWDDFPWAEGISWFTRGMGAVHTSDLTTAHDAEQQLNRLRDYAKENDNNDMANYIEIDRRILSGWIAHAEGDDKKAEESLRSAAELESSVEKHPVTPGAVIPPNEALGDLLMELGRPDDALEAYEASDKIWPERYNTLLGAAQAANASGNDQKADQYYERLLANAGESKRNSLEVAKDFSKN